MLRTAKLRLAVILIFTIGSWLGLFTIFALGYHFLKGAIQNLTTLDEAVRMIFGMFFASLMFMLTLSSAIILYATLFRSEETTSLLTLPIRPERIVMYRLQEAIVFSSWGFMLVGSPMLMAYGAMENAPIWFYVLLIPFMLAFSLIPCSLGALICLFTSRLVPTIRIRYVVLALFFIAALVMFFVFPPDALRRASLFSSGWFQQTAMKLRFSQNWFLPSWWLSSGLLEAARADLSSAKGTQALAESFLLFALLLSHGLMLALLVNLAAGRQLLPAYSVIASLGSKEKKHRFSWLDRCFSFLMGWLPLRMKLLVQKDLKTFRRDPIQWSQFLILFGLLSLYFVNVRRFSYGVEYKNWISAISFLNMAVIGLLLSAFTTRFVYPMISLEGKRFWVLGLMPIERKEILLAKFAYALISILIPCSMLILISDVMLETQAIVVGIHLMLSLLLSSGLSGIAIGLGARLPNLRENSPAKIAAGFGGTLNLVVSTLYILITVAMTAVPCQWALIVSDQYFPGHPLRESIWRWVVIGSAGSVALGISATLLPLWIGIRSLNRMET